MSSQSPVSPPAEARLDEHRASREAVRRVVDFVWLALSRRGVPYRDRYDVLQEILVAALEAWPRYDAELATPDKWLNGIILHHVLRWRARCEREPLADKSDHELRDGAETAEELLMSEERRRLA